MTQNPRKPKSAEVAAWLLLRLLDWHRTDLGHTANVGGMDVNGARKVRFPATLDNVTFMITVEEMKK